MMVEVIGRVSVGEAEEMGVVWLYHIGRHLVSNNRKLSCSCLWGLTKHHTEGLK